MVKAFQLKPKEVTKMSLELDESEMGEKLDHFIEAIHSSYPREGGLGTVDIKIVDGKISQVSAEQKNNIETLIEGAVAVMPPDSLALVFNSPMGEANVMMGCIDRIQDENSRSANPS